MSTTLANQVRPAGTPIFCSACHNQDSSARHVDFDAACDRGYGSLEDNPDIKISMDDLVLCETCLRHGASLVGLVDADEQGARVESLERRLAEETRRCEQAVNYANRMEEALAARPEPIQVSRPRGRPPRQKEKEAA
jgi:hypothetical protein